MAIARLTLPMLSIGLAFSAAPLGLSLTPLYANIRPDQRDQEPRITGYQAANTVSVRLQKLDLIGQMIDAGLAAGANQVDGIDFGLRDEEPVRARALAQAVRAAREKAQAIAAALEVQLGEVVEATEGVSSTPPPRFEGRNLTGERGDLEEILGVLQGWLAAHPERCDEEL